MFFGGFKDELCVGGFILIEKDERYWPNHIGDKAYYFINLLLVRDIED